MLPLNDLQRHNQPLAAELRAAMDRVLSRGWFVMGPELEAFESAFATYCDMRSCVGVGNGTDALEIALRALQIGPGDQVATVANAGMYGATAILNAGADPLFVDVDPVSLTMDPGALAAVLTSATRAVIVTHLYGRMADMPAILRQADRAGIPVIEDCAQAHGARLAGKRAGAWGKIGCFSFYPTKNLGALGDGGALVTSDDNLAAQMRTLRQYGWAGKYNAETPGGRNSRLDEIQAAVLGVKLPHLDRWNQRRREIAWVFSQALANTSLTPQAIADDSCVAHLYVVRAPARQAFRDAMTAAGVATEIHYPIPDHHQAAIRHRDFACVSLPVTEQACREVATLPCFPEMTEAEIDRVIDAVRGSQMSDVRCQKTEVRSQEA